MAKKSTDDAVMELLRTVKQKKDEIKALSRKPNWLTTCTLGRNSDSAADRVNIMTIVDPARIIELYTFLLEKELHWEKAAKDLGFDLAPTHQGYSIADWKADLKTRASQLVLEQKRRDIDTLDKRINSLVSPDQRREMELEALQKELGVTE